MLLAEEIVTGKLPPGARLDEVEQARRFGVSRTPVREAFRQLAAQGLVETRPHRGVVVTPLTSQLVRDLLEACAEMLALCARLAAGRMTGDQRRALAHARGDDEVVRGLSAGAGNTVLQRLLDGVWRRSRPLHPSDGLLTEVAQAVAARDGDKAAALAAKALTSAGHETAARMDEN